MSHSTQYRSFRRRGPWAVRYISHSVMEGQRHNNPLTSIAFVYNKYKHSLRETEWTVTVDSSLSFRTHVNRVVSSCFHQLRRIKGSLKALPQETAKSLVNCFLVSRLDYCNSLLAGVPQVTLDRLQCVMNTAARMPCSVGRRAHVSDLLHNRYKYVSILDFIGAKDGGGGGDNWSCKTCEAPVESSPPTNKHPTFYRPDVFPITQHFFPTPNNVCSSE